MCLLGFFQGSNYQVKYHRKNDFVYSCILMYEWEDQELLNQATGGQESNATPSVTAQLT